MTEVNNSTEIVKDLPRLLPHIVDDIAASDPSRPFIYQPKSSNPEDGWVPVTFKEFANAIDHVAHIISETIKKDSADDFPTIAYVGPNDVRYGVILLASIKAGCKALFISPRNSVEGQLSLFEQTKCCYIWYAQSFHLAVGTWLSKREMKSWVVPPLEEWLEATPSPVLYCKSFEEACWDPLVVLHTSGSTGFPKPIVVKQGGLAVMDIFKGLPKYMGGEFLIKFWQSSATRIFLPMPLFHAAGLFAGILASSIYYGVPCALQILDQPATADFTVRCLQYSGSDAALLAPSIIEELSVMGDGVEVLKRLRFVSFGGGNLSKTAGDSLVEQGVVLNNCISSTEFCPYATYFQPQPKLWQYFIFNSELMGAEWRPHDPENRIYELVVRRKDPKEPLDQSVFYSFPDLTEWCTRDLFKAHPTLKDHWMYYGRADNIIVFSNGEKLNPVTIEDSLVGHPLIKGAIVVGQDRFQPALILEPATLPKTHEESEAIIESAWPLINDLNKVTVSHGRISKELVVLSDPDLPFSRASKGTVQRGLTVQAYRLNIDDIYKQANAIRTVDVKPLDFASMGTTLKTITQLFTDQTSIKDIRPDADFFTAGLDSLQVMNFSKSLRAGFAASGAKIDESIVAPRAVYSNPTLEQLAKHLYAAIHRADSQQNTEEDKEISLMKSLISRYTAGLPACQADKPKPREDGQTIILTGSTGSLGAYLLDILCNAPHIKAVVALNRGDDGGKLRQPGVSAARDLGTDFSKVEFLSADLSQPDLGLGAVKYKEVLAAVDRIIHNAWPVNFNMTVSSFEPSIRGVRHLVNCSAAAAKQVPITFLSTIDTISNWNSSDKVPESRLTDLSLPETGYGRSKLAGSLILDAAAEFGVPSVSIRVGQIAGPRSAKGKWNPQEFMPSLIKSSVYLGVLPQELGPLEVVDWMPIEDVAGLILDISGITQSKDISEIKGYMHCVNPQMAKWADLAVAIKDFFGDQVLELVTLEEWVSVLEKSAADVSNTSENPGVKLLPTYQGILAGQRAGQGHVYLDMKRTVAQSGTAGRVGPVTADLMRNWCTQWNF
ncbi:NRPS-like protein [Pseudogymnoascus sp. 23342-1-I1]|nr:NRPS-like protein [Pseudogymnoascus sp. 23342-1-I1]